MPPRDSRRPAPRPHSHEEQHHNRVAIALRHGWRYAFASQARLANDVGCARSTISRLLAGKTRPTPTLMQRIARALSYDLGVRIPVEELFSPDGAYPTRSGCRLCGCDGCLPEEAYDARGSLRPAYRHQRPGDWSLAPKRRQAGNRE